MVRCNEVCCCSGAFHALLETGSKWSAQGFGGQFRLLQALWLEEGGTMMPEEAGEVKGPGLTLYLC